MALKLKRTGGAPGEYNVPVRHAHDRAIQERRTVRESLEEYYQELMAKEYERRVAEIDMNVARVIEVELAKGVPRMEIRRAIKTNAPDMWNRYMQYITTGKDGENLTGAENGESSVKSELPPLVMKTETYDGEEVTWDFANRAVIFRGESYGWRMFWKDRMSRKPLINEELPPEADGPRLTREQAAEAFEAGYQWDDTRSGT